jgi:hypothetical protein
MRFGARCRPDLGMLTSVGACRRYPNPISTLRIGWRPRLARPLATHALHWYARYLRATGMTGRTRSSDVNPP